MKKKAIRRRRQYRKRRVPRGLTSRGSDIATCRANLGVVNLTANTPYQLFNFSLSNSDRAVAIAKGYQFYRIPLVEITFKASVDTYAGSSSVPHLYYMVDRANTFPTGTDLDTIKGAGAKPHRLDDKTIVCRFKPAVHLVSDDSAGGPAPVAETAGMVKVSPWLPTNGNAGEPSAWTPNSVDHRGLVFCVEQVIAGNISVGTMEVVVHYEFKKALWQPKTSDPSLYKIDLDTLTIVPPVEPEAKLLE